MKIKQINKTKEYLSLNVYYNKKKKKKKKKKKEKKKGTVIDN